MARYRKRPVVIEAVRNDGMWLPIIEWLDNLADGKFRIPFGSTPPIVRNSIDGTLSIATLEGTMRADVGDWIIRGVQGEFYPCKPDVFAATYEPADGGPS
jgi:hypothetical protein